jgi:hypothetical protein
MAKNTENAIIKEYIRYMSSVWSVDDLQVMEFKNNIGNFFLKKNCA